jgi:hypothetical protein
VTGRRSQRIKKGDHEMAISFASDIRPMFRPIDVEHMKKHGVLLDDFAYMSRAENDNGNARAVLETVVWEILHPCRPGGRTGRRSRSPSIKSGWTRDSSPEEGSTLVRHTRAPLSELCAVRM